MTAPPPPVPAPDPEDDAIRQLAAELARQFELPFEPTTLTKGTITAIDYTGSPPTLSIQVSGDSSVTLTKVRLLNNYSPEIGHTVLIAKQGADLVVLGHIAELSARSVNDNAGGWKRLDPSNGSHGGGENGDIYYRRILDHGSWKMQWRGGWNTSETATMLLGGTLPVECRPSSRRTVLCARSTNGAASVQMNFNTDGGAVLSGGTAANFVSSAATTPPNVSTVEPFTDTIDPVDNTLFVEVFSSTVPSSSVSSSEVPASGVASTSVATGSVDEYSSSVSTGGSGGTGGASAGTAHTHGVSVTNSSHSHYVTGAHGHGSHSHGTHDHGTHSHGTHAHGSHDHGTHRHSVSGGHRHQVDPHFHTNGSHKHVTEVWVDPPTWISLNGVEYFL
jgi:hypothetical protein